MSTFFFDLPPFSSQTFTGFGTSAPHFGQTTLKNWLGGANPTVDKSDEGCTPGIVSVPDTGGCSCEVSVDATAAEASTTGTSSTTFTTSASATSSTRSGDGPAPIDSSETMPDSVSPVGRAESAVVKADCGGLSSTRPGVTTALLVCGAGAVFPLFCGRGVAGEEVCGLVSAISALNAVDTGLVKGTWSEGAEMGGDARTRGEGRLGDGAALVQSGPSATLTAFGIDCLNSPGESGLVSMWDSVSIICLISSILCRFFSSRPLNSCR